MKGPRLFGAGKLGRDGPWLYAVSCGGCTRTVTLSRKRRRLTRQYAAQMARSEGWTYGAELGWTCPGCRFAWAAGPGRTAQPHPGRPAPAPWRRVVSELYNVRDAEGQRVAGFGELLSCGHINIPSEGVRSGNRRRRCLDCQREGVSVKE